MSMSLFASAFDPTPGAGPSTSYASKSLSSTPRRKRSATGGDVDRLKATQANLEKLMRGVEKGDALQRRERSDGREEMGHPASGKKRKQQNGEVLRPHVHSKGAKVVKGDYKSHPVKAQSAKVHQESQALPRRPNGHTKASDKGKFPVKQGQPLKPTIQAKNRTPPAKLPVPHSRSTSEVTQRLEEKGLTEMQKGMKSKLEGARFRFVSSSNTR